jgi:hypothetical protein
VGFLCGGNWGEVLDMIEPSNLCYNEQSFSRRTGIQSLACYVYFYVGERKIVIVKILNMHNIDMYL